jgi:hypothetical protein
MGHNNSITNFTDVIKYLHFFEITASNPVPGGRYIHERQKVGRHLDLVVPKSHCLHGRRTNWTQNKMETCFCLPDLKKILICILKGLIPSVAHCNGRENERFVVNNLHLLDDVLRLVFDDTPFHLTYLQCFDHITLARAQKKWVWMNENQSASHTCRKKSLHKKIKPKKK